MAVITGTAFSKNTPVRVLQELEHLERREAGQIERIHAAQPAEDEEERKEAHALGQPDSVTPVRE